MKNYSIDSNMKLPANVKRIPVMEADLKRVINEPAFEELLQRYTGPMVGLEYDDKTGKLSIAGGWHADEVGNIVKD